MIKNQMTSLQRVLTTLGHKEPDRVPFFLLATMHGAKELGLSIKEYFSKPENVGSNNTIGFEANGKYSPLDWLTINGDFNFNYFDRNGFFESQSFDFTGNRWSTSITAKVKLPADFDFEISENYNSKYETLQQMVSAINFVDLGVRKKIVKGRIILNLSVRDVFATRVDETITSQPDFYLYNSRQRGRFINFGISYGFGKGEAMQFSGQRR